MATPSNSDAPRNKEFAWVKRSLGEGKRLSEAVLDRFDIEKGQVRLLGIKRSDAPLERGFGDPSVVSRATSAEELWAISTSLGEPGARSVLVIEDDIRIATDPSLEGRSDVATRGSSVFHWREVADIDDADALRRFLDSSASGYPLNAFFVSIESTRSARSELETDPRSLVTGVLAVVNSVFDGEAYLLWMPTDRPS